MFCFLQSPAMPYHSLPTYYVLECGLSIGQTSTLLRIDHSLALQPRNGFKMISDRLQ